MRISRKCAHKWHGFYAFVAAAIALAAVGYFVFSHRTAPTSPAPSAADAGFDTAFGTAGIYESSRK